jgi:hypothetical protein
VIAAIYARKSTEQSGVADEARSVGRHVEHAKACAQLKNWRVDDRYVFVDDGMSGAEFPNRPGFVRLMTALKPKPPFDVLIMSEESRLGRGQIEVSYAVKQFRRGRHSHLPLSHRLGADDRLADREGDAGAASDGRRNGAREGAHTHGRRDGQEGAEWPRLRRAHLRL